MHMTVMKRMFVAVVLMGASACATIAPDYGREQRWADEIVPGLVVGNAVSIETASKRRFLGILAPSQRSRVSYQVLFLCCWALTQSS